MSRTKIAPTLRRFIDERTCGQDECGGRSECHRVRADLDALLAVVRAGCARHPTYKVLREPTAECPTCRALWRLRRVSGGARTTKGGGR